MTTKKGTVFYNERFAGYIAKEDDNYYFTYAEDYLASDENPSISLTLPRRKEPFVSRHLFPFFFGLLAEGDNKELQCRTLLIDEDDHFTRLIRTAGKDTIGGITIKPLYKLTTKKI